MCENISSYKDGVGGGYWSRPQGMWLGLSLCVVWFLRELEEPPSTRLVLLSKSSCKAYMHTLSLSLKVH